MATLWEKMTRIYGHAWSSLSERDDGTWLVGLCGLSPRDLATGLSACLSRNSDFPPSLPEFKRLCIGITSQDIDQFIEDKAFNGIDSFSRNRMTYDDIAKAKRRVTKDHIAEFIQLRINEKIKLNTNLLKLQPVDNA